MREVMTTMETCKFCSAEFKPVGCGIGYATILTPDNSEIKICYQCCAIEDKRAMRERGEHCLYLVECNKSDIIQERYMLTNWPNTLKLPLIGMRIGRHNMARTRIDVWFVFEGYIWHGVQWGECSQLCRVKQTKERWVYDKGKATYYGTRSRKATG